MNCKNCGNLIDDDSKFCIYCGSNQSEVIIKKTSEYSENVNTNSRKGSRGVLIGILVFILIGILIIVIYWLNYDNGSMKSNSDVIENNSNELEIIKDVQLIDGDIFIITNNSGKLQITNNGINFNPIIDPYKKYILYIKKTQGSLAYHPQSIDGFESNEVWKYSLQRKKNELLLKGGHKNNGLYFRNNGKYIITNNGYLLFTCGGGSGGPSLYKCNVYNGDYKLLIYDVNDYSVEYNGTELIIKVEIKEYKEYGGFYYKEVYIDINGNISDYL